MRIPFNKPYATGDELKYMGETISAGKTSGNQQYSKRIHSFFNNRYGFEKSLFTTSCTDALEMSAILLNIGSGDEVIVPSFTFVSTANAFVLRGAKLVFGDSNPQNPNLDPDLIEPLITKKTKAIVVVHYAGIACDMDRFQSLCEKYNLHLIEDAAQAIDSYYKGRSLGAIGDMSTFSFHETKNLACGEGGLLAINNDEFSQRAEIIWEKGTNRSAFFRGEVNKYGWVDIGSSYLASDILGAYLFAQLENIDRIQKRRISIWNTYYRLLKEGEDKELFFLPHIPDYATNNGHMFYLVCRSFEERSKLILFLKERNIHAVFHYLSLHKSEFYSNKHDGRELLESDRYTDCLVRLPMFYELSDIQINKIVDCIFKFFSQQK